VENKNDGTQERKELAENRWMRLTMTKKNKQGEQKKKGEINQINLLKSRASS